MSEICKQLKPAVIVQGSRFQLVSPLAVCNYSSKGDSVSMNTVIRLAQTFISLESIHPFLEGRKRKAFNWKNGCGRKKTLREKIF